MCSDVDQTANICDLPFKIYNELVQELNKQDTWKQLLGVACSEDVFSLKDHEVDECLRKRMETLGSAGYLLNKWGNRGMAVSDLVDYMDQLHLERGLKLIRTHESLRITEQPELCLGATVGGYVELECVATGFPYPRYTWFHCDDKNKLHELPTKSTGVLSLTTIGCENQGKYMCRIHQDVDNRAEVLWSNDGVWCEVKVKLVPGYKPPATVHKPVIPSADLVMAPMFQHQPESSVMVGFFEAFILQARAVGNPEPTYSWLKNDTLIVGADLHDLLVDRATLEDNGTYQCIARNKHGETKSHAAIVQVRIPQTPSDVPIVLVHPTGQKQGLGGVAKFRVEATGRPPLLYQWFHRNKVMPGATSSELCVDINDKSQSGEYQCHVYNMLEGKLLGECMSNVACLEVDTRTKKSYTATDKVALLIAVSSSRMNAKTKPLPGAFNDLHEMATKLEKLGFKTLSLLDLDRTEMMAAIDLFCDLVDEGVYGVIYLCGHGFVHHGRNYFVACDAFTEPGPADCLCVEEAMHKIQKEKLAVSCMILDLCRTEYSGCQTPITGCSLPPVSGSEIIFFASSPGERAYEEKAGNVPCPRGIFSQNLTKIIDHNVPIVDLHKALVDEFQQGPYSIDKYPQHPELVSRHLEHDRSLCDPIDTTGTTTKMNTRCVQWMQVNDLPVLDNVPISINQATFKLSIRAERFFSNVMRIYFHLTYLQTKHLRPMKYTITIDEKSVPQDLRPIEQTVTSDGHFVFSIGKLQRLRSDLVLVILVSFHFEHLQQPVVKRHHLPLGTPLISKVKHLFVEYANSYSKPHHREPTEHETKVNTEDETTC